MRYALVLAAAALLASSHVRAADPPITFQAHSVDRVLGDVRAAADLVGGQKAVMAFNKELKKSFGEKGFEGLDLNKPIVGYVVLAPKPLDIVAVVALPVTGEKEFLALCDRANAQKHKPLKGGLYELPPPDPLYKARMRFKDGYAYIAYGANPEPALEAKALVPAGKLYDPAEKAVISAKFHFDRLTPEVKKAMPVLIDEVKKTLFAGPGIGKQEGALLKPVTDELEKMAARYMLLLGGADSATLRVGVDVPTSDLVIEATLTPKPDTPLAKEIAAWKPTGNKFGALLTPDTVAGVKLRLPFFNDELKAAATKGLELAQKEMLKTAPPTAKPLIEEGIKGLIRTVKTGEFDIVGGVRGPDKDGWFTVAAAVAFEDSAALGKAFREFVEKEAPPDEQTNIKWDADKAGNVGIHTYKFPGGAPFLDPTKVFGGDKCTLAFAFAPKGIFLVLGPDAVAVMKDALAIKQSDAAGFDFVMNPHRMGKLFEKFGSNPLEVEKALGKEDKLLSATSFKVTGGKELTARLAINLRLLPRAIVAESIERSDKEPVPPVEKR
jgi:hypothetical protein